MIIDYIGTVLIVLATLLLLLGFTWAGDRTIDWLSWQSLALFGAALVLVVELVAYSAWQEQLGRGPIVEPSMVKDVRVFSVSLVAKMLISVVLIGAVYFLPVFMQSVVGISATSGHAAFQALLDAVKMGVTESIHQGFVVCLMLMVQTLVVVLLLKEIPLRSKMNREG